MAQRYNFYVAIGNNGYCMTSSWSDIKSFVAQLDNPWHHGFYTEEDAYEWLKDNYKTHWPLKNYKMCDIDTLRKDKFILVEEAKDAEEDRPGPLVIKRPKKSLKELLDEEDDEMPVTGGRKRDAKQELIKAFEAWLADCEEKLKGEA